MFLLEMVLKLTALGPRGYVKSRWNIFDGFIVVISIVDLILERGIKVGNGAGLSVLRTFRLVSELSRILSFVVRERIRRGKTVTNVVPFVVFITL